MEKSSTTKMALRVSGAVVRLLLNVLFYAVVVYLIIKAGTYTYNFAYQVFGSVSYEAAPGVDRDFQILKGESTFDIANKLEVSNLVVDKYSFYIKTKLKEYDIMPGTFILNSSMDYDEILEVITNLKNSIAVEETVEEHQDTP